MNRRYYRRTKLGKVEYDVMSQLSFGDLMISILMSGRSTKRMYAIARERAAARQSVERAVCRLQERGYITATSEENVGLTPSGRKLLEREIVRLRQGLKGKVSWDGKWRLVAFDVPEVWRESRSALRLVLKRAGFHQLQQSVWVHPHECAELVFLLEEDKRLYRNVIRVEATAITGEELLMRKFGLKRDRER